MTRIFLIRHAEAEGNLYRRIQGQYDSLVTERGLRQMRALGHRFDGERIDAVYASDLVRARVTASAVASSRGLAVMRERGLREVDMGVWEDVPWGEVERYEPQMLHAFNSNPAQWKIEGGEDFYDLQARLTQTLRSIASRHGGETVAMVSHGCAIRAFLCGALGVAPQEIGRVAHGDNTAVALIRYDHETFTVERFGDNTHLPPEESTLARQSWWRGQAAADRANMRYLPFDPERDGALYAQLRADARRELCGDLNGLRIEQCVRTAAARAAENKNAVSLALTGDTPAGFVELDIPAGDGAGVIDFCCMRPELRLRGLGCQLIGQATSVYRRMGRDRLRMTLGRDNAAAMAFFQKCGFQVTAGAPGGAAVMLEKRIATADFTRW